MAVQSRLLRDARTSCRRGSPASGGPGSWASRSAPASCWRCAGVLVAARRAARVRPLEALRETGEAARVMTAGPVDRRAAVPRWRARADHRRRRTAAPRGGQAMAMNVSMCAAVALAAFGPLLVPAVGPAGAGRLRRGDRRAGPGQPAGRPAAQRVGGGAGDRAGRPGARASPARARRSPRPAIAEQRADHGGRPGGRVDRADRRLVPRDRLAAASTETSIPVTCHHRPRRGRARPRRCRRSSSIRRPYAAAHPGAAAHSPRCRHRPSRPARAVTFRARSAVRVRLADADLGALPVVAASPEAMSGGASCCCRRAWSRPTSWPTRRPGPS